MELQEVLRFTRVFLVPWVTHRGCDDTPCSLSQLFASIVVLHASAARYSPVWLASLLSPHSKAVLRPELRPRVLNHNASRMSMRSLKI